MIDFSSVLLGAAGVLFAQWCIAIAKRSDTVYREKLAVYKEVCGILASISDEVAEIYFEDLIFDTGKERILSQAQELERIAVANIPLIPWKIVYTLMRLRADLYHANDREELFIDVKAHVKVAFKHIRNDVSVFPFGKKTEEVIAIIFSRKKKGRNSASRKSKG